MENSLTSIDKSNQLSNVQNAQKTDNSFAVSARPAQLFGTQNTSGMGGSFSGGGKFDQDFLRGFDAETQHPWQSGDYLRRQNNTNQMPYSPANVDRIVDDLQSGRKKPDQLTNGEMSVLAHDVFYGLPRPGTSKQQEMFLSAASDVGKRSGKMAQGTIWDIASHITDFGGVVVHNWLNTATWDMYQDEYLKNLSEVNERERALQNPEKYWPTTQWQLMENYARSREKLDNTWQSYEATMEKFKPVPQWFYDQSDEMERRSDAIKSEGLDGTEGTYRFYLEYLVPELTEAGVFCH